MIPVATFEAKPVVAGQPPELSPIRKLPKKTRKMYWEEAKLGLVQVPGKQDVPRQCRQRRRVPSAHRWCEPVEFNGARFYRNARRRRRVRPLGGGNRET